MLASRVKSLCERLPPAISAGTEVDKELGGPVSQRLPAAVEDPDDAIFVVSIATVSAGIGGASGLVVTTSLPSTKPSGIGGGGGLGAPTGDRLPAAASAPGDSIISGWPSILASSLVTFGSCGGAAEADLDVVPCIRLPAAVAERAEVTEPEAETKVGFFLGAMISAECNT